MALVLGDQPRQSSGQYFGAPGGHVGCGRRIYLESARAMEYMVSVNRGDGGGIFVAAGSDE
jgi:hypothetical protein